MINKYDNKPAQNQPAAQLYSALWLPDILQPGVPAETRGYAVCTSWTGNLGNQKPSMLSSYCVYVCVCMCKWAAQRAEGNTDQFYWALKLRWPNKQPGKTPLLLELTLFPRMQTGSVSDRGRRRKERREARERRGGWGCPSYAYPIYIHTFTPDVCIYGVYIVAHSCQKTVFPIHTYPQLKDAPQTDSAGW